MKYKDESDSDESDNFEEKRKVAVLRKMIILKIVKRMRVLMMELLMSQKSFVKHGIIFLCPLMIVKLWESCLHGYMKQKEQKIIHRSVNSKMALDQFDGFSENVSFKERVQPY